MSEENNVITGEACPTCAARLNRDRGPYTERPTSWGELFRLVFSAADVELTHDGFRIVHEDLTETFVRLLGDVRGFAMASAMMAARRSGALLFFHRMQGLDFSTGPTDSPPAYIRLPVVPPKTATPERS